jgi:hypothetical protein
MQASAADYALIHFTTLKWQLVILPIDQTLPVAICPWGDSASNRDEY